jgi:hypothetical protein
MYASLNRALAAQRNNALQMGEFWSAKANKMYGIIGFLPVAPVLLQLRLRC